MTANDPGHINNLDAKQSQTLKEFWKCIGKHMRDETKPVDPFYEAELFLAIGYDNPDVILLRWLRAKKWDVQRALQQLLETVQWRHQWGVKDFLAKGEFDIEQDEIRTGKSYFLGKDKQGRPINHVSARDHVKDQFPGKSTEKITVFSMETGRKLLTDPIESVTVVFDMSGFSLKNMDYQHLKFLINLLENFYPESFALGLIINAPWIFNGCWYIIRPWLDPIVESKIHFINNLSDISRFIDAEMLPKRLNGTLPDFEYIPPTEEDSAMLTAIRNDQEGKVKAEEVHRNAVENYLSITYRWVHEDENEEIVEERRKAMEVLRDAFQQLVPYIHTRTHYHRTGEIQEPSFDILYQKLRSQ